MSGLCSTAKSHPACDFIHVLRVLESVPHPEQISEDIPAQAIVGVSTKLVAEVFSTMLEVLSV